MNWKTEFIIGLIAVAIPSGILGWLLWEEAGPKMFIALLAACGLSLLLVGGLLLMLFASFKKKGI